MAEIQTWFTHTTGIEWRWLSFWSCAPKDLKTFALLEVSPSEYSTRKRAVMESIITSLIAPLFSSNGRRCVMMFCKSSCQIVVQNMYVTALIFYLMCLSFTFLYSLILFSQELMTYAKKSPVNVSFGAIAHLPLP